MAASVGIRIYLITLQKRGASKSLPFGSTLNASYPPAFISSFIISMNSMSKNEILERSLFLEEKVSGSIGCSKGYIHYGTFGFESNFIDSTTKERHYRRKVSDVEEIPLYYEFWFPAGMNYGFAAFQSFQGRSCIQLLISKMRDEYAASNKEHALNVRKLTPSDKNGGVFAQALVKRLRLIRKNVSPDIADRYLGSRDSDYVDFEVSLTAKARRSLGSLGSVTRAMRKSEGIVISGEERFDKVVAEIRVGNKVRKVGLFGGDGDTGVIDLTDSVPKGADGHPDFFALTKEVDAILKEFASVIAGSTI